MYDFFKAALKFAGAGAVAAALITVIYPAVLASPAVKSLSQLQQFAILAFIAVSTFLIAFGLLAIVFKGKGRGQSSPTIIVERSKVGGDVVGGNKTTNGTK
ncbi:hypothetical protein ACET4R_19800 [Pseudomonas aeruginosa]|uniref:hypothetical protein n=1 Tax=Pseudomonas aeruginosa TaxID=287 RepID=UPI0036E2932E|nr:hypothetical protein [Pseudomonas aeruginosa]